MFNLLKSRKLVEKKPSGKELDFLASCLTHELKTPLVSIKSSVTFAKEIFPELIKIYQIATEKNIIDNTIDQCHLNNIVRSLSNSENEIYYLDYYLTKLSDSLNIENFEDSKVEKISLIKTLHEALNFHIGRYELYGSTVFFDKKIKDHEAFFSKKILYKAFLYLLDNILRMAFVCGEKVITVAADYSHKEYVLQFIVSGITAHAKKFDNLFEKFPSKNEQRLGAGMYYFKKAIENSGGKVFVSNKNKNFIVKIKFH